MTVVNRQLCVIQFQCEQRLVHGRTKYRGWA